jgi:hypothetical protein
MALKFGKQCIFQVPLNSSSSFLSDIDELRSRSVGLWWVKAGKILRFLREMLRCRGTTPRFNYIAFALALMIFMARLATLLVLPPLHDAKAPIAAWVGAVSSAAVAAAVGVVRRVRRRK